MKGEGNKKQVCAAGPRNPVFTASCKTSNPFYIFSEKE